MFYFVQTAPFFLAQPLYMIVPKPPRETRPVENIMCPLTPVYIAQFIAQR